MAKQQGKQRRSPLEHSGDGVGGCFLSPPSVLGKASSGPVPPRGKVAAGQECQRLARVKKVTMGPSIPSTSPGPGDYQQGGSNVGKGQDRGAGSLRGICVEHMGIE